MRAGQCKETHSRESALRSSFPDRRARALAYFRFSRLAEADLLRIGEYTLDVWGADQASQYLLELEECCQKLADHPQLGRACDEILPGLRRLEHGRHVIFYREKEDFVFISRVLHQRMLPEKHGFGDEVTAAK